jgi:RNA polymerase sigma-70 factor (ECF subfamily)
LGTYVTQAFLDANASVIGTSRKITQSQFNSPNFTAMPGDISSREGAQVLVGRVLERFGRLDVLAHTIGGFAGGQSVAETDDATFQRMLDLNLNCAALSLLKNDADAEDVAQEAVLKAFKNLSRFRQEAKFSTWLIQIAINEAKMKLRKDRRHLYDSIEGGQLGDYADYIPRDFADWREIPSEALQQKELREALTKALASLPEKYRAVLILRDVQQLSITETAVVLGITEANVKTRLSRARLQMRDALAPGLSELWNQGGQKG